MKTQLNTKIIFGEQQFPVRLGKMVAQFKVKTEGCCPHCDGETGQKKYCKDCEKELGWKEPLRAYRFTKDEKQIITDEQNKALDSQTKNIVIRGRVNRDDIDIRTTLSGHYLASAESESKSKKDQDEENANFRTMYSVLYNGIKNSDQALVVDFAVGENQKLGVLLTTNEGIIIKEIAFKGEVRPFDESKPIKLDEEQTKVANDFITSIKEIDPTSIENPSKETLEKILKGELEIVEVEVKKPSLNFFKQ